MKSISCGVFMLFCLLCYFWPSYGADRTKTPKEMIRAPQFFHLGRTNGNDVIKMECEGQPPNYIDIDCQFTQVSVFKKTPAELAEAKKQRQKDYDKMTPKDFNDTKNSFKNIKKELTKERQALLNSMTPEKKLYSKRFVDSFEAMSSAKNKEELIKMMEDNYALDDKCCEIRIHTWKNQFKRISQLKWLSNPGPEGLCNVVRVFTLEANDDNYLLWKYTEVAVSVDVDKKRNDLGDKICGEIELNKPAVYSWDIPTDFVGDCECIKYSW